MRAPSPDTPVIYNVAEKRWTIGTEAPRPWLRWIANAAALLVTLAAIFAGVCVAVETVADMPHVFL